MENPTSWNQTGKIIELGLQSFWSSAKTQHEQAIFLAGMLYCAGYFTDKATVARVIESISASLSDNSGSKFSTMVEAIVTELHTQKLMCEA